MKNLKSSKSNASRRWVVLGLLLFIAVVAASVSWNWNQHVNLPDPGIVIHTESEAVDGARRFLAGAKIGTSDYDISHPSYITTDRLKGAIVWDIVWLAKLDAKTTNKLSVLASENGWFDTDERMSSNQGVTIEGEKTNQFNFIFTRSPFTLVPQNQLDFPTNGMPAAKDK